MPRMISNRIKKFVVLDGSTSYITIPVTPSITGFNISFWFWKRNINNGARILNWMDTGSIGGFTFVENTAGDCLLQMKNSSTVVGSMLTGVKPNGSISHIVITNDGTNTKLYENSILVATDTSSTISAATEPFTIGKRSSGNYWGGSFGELVVHNTTNTWTQNDIDNLYYRGIIPTGALYWTFDGNVNENTGSGINGTANNCTYLDNNYPRQSITKKRRKTNYNVNSLYFTSNSYVTKTSTSLLNFGSSIDFTLSCKFKTSSKGSNKLLVGKGSGPTTYRLRIGTGNNIEALIGSGSVITISGNTIVTDGVWHTVYATFDRDGNCRIFLDGVEDCTPVSISSIGDIDIATDFRVGENSSGSDDFTGYIDDVRVYRYVLSTSEILSENTLSQPILEWKFDETFGTTAVDSSFNGNDGTINNCSHSFDTSYNERLTKYDCTVASITKTALGAQELNTANYIDKMFVYFNGNEYVCFVNSSGNVGLGKRSIPSGSWTIVDTGFYINNPTDSHYVASMEIDSNGYIHISYGMHVGALIYKRSNSPENITAFSTASMVGIDEDSVSYPRFFKANNVLYFSYRNGGSSIGHQYLNKYDVGTATWSSVAHKLIDGESNAVYCDNFAVGNDGTIHVSFLWRVSSSPITSANYSYAYSSDGGNTWKKSNGDSQAVPITQSNADIFDSGNVDGLINQNHIDVDSNNRPHISYWKLGSNGRMNYFHTFYDGNSWRKNQVTNFKSTINSIITFIETKFARPGILVDRRTNRVLIFTRPYENSRIEIYESYPPYASYRKMCLGDLNYGRVEFGNIDYDRWHSDHILYMSVMRDYTKSPGELLRVNSNLSKQNRTSTV